MKIPIINKDIIIIFFLTTALFFTIAVHINLYISNNLYLSTDTIENIDPFADIVRDDLYISDIIMDGDTFRWTLDDDIDTSNIKGFNYTIKINDNTLVVGHTSDKELRYSPTHNGEFSFSVTPIDLDLHLGQTSTYNFIVKDDGLEEFILANEDTYSVLLEDTELNKIFNDIVITSGDTSLTALSLLYEELRQVPMSILNNINKNKFKICLTSYDLKILNKIDDDKNITGLFSAGTKTIYVSTWYNYIERSTIHEIGHYVDFIIGKGNYYSETDSIFLDIFDKEKEFTYSDHYSSRPREYFAYAFNKYIKEPISLREIQPETFEYMQKYFEKYF